MKQQLRFTLILHDIRIKLGLSLIKYCIADSIYHLSNNPDSKVKGWCFASKQYIADFLGVKSVRTIFNNIKDLVEDGFLEKDKETKYLRTTKKWYEEVVLMKAKKEYAEIAQPMQKLHTPSAKIAQSSRAKNAQYNNTTDKNTNRYRTPAQEMKLFLTDEKYPKQLAKQISEKSNISYEQVLSELRNFAGYWSELNKSGTKQRWQLQKTFELKRRLGTWFRNKDKFNKGKKSIIL